MSGRKGARLFPGIVFGLIGLNLAVVGVTVYFATSDPSFAVEPGYDRKALGWDEEAARRRRSEALGWTASVAPDPARGRVEVRLTDEAGGPVEGAVVTGMAFRSARASRRFDLAFEESAPGVYAAALAMEEGGIWEFRLGARRGGEEFAAEARCELVELSAGEMGRGGRP